MTNQEIKDQASDIRKDLVDADECTRAIIIAELHSLDKLAKARGFTVMYVLGANWSVRAA
jgi:hypothetical protein